MKKKYKWMPLAKYEVKCPYKMKPIGITVHDTANDASAQNEIDYMISNNEFTSYHVAIDDSEAIQCIPFDRNAFHAGDGANGTGNRKTIGIETCYSKSGGAKYDKAFDNVLNYVCELMKKYGFSEKDVYYHKHWSGKNCPHRLLSKGITQEKYRKLVKERYDQMYKKKDYVGHWAENAIKEVVKKDIMSFNKDGNFRPDDKVTRAELASVIARAIKLFEKK